MSHAQFHRFNWILFPLFHCSDEWELIKSIYCLLWSGAGLSSLYAYFSFFTENNLMWEVLLLFKSKNTGRVYKLFKVKKPRIMEPAIHHRSFDFRVHVLSYVIYLLLCSKWNLNSALHCFTVCLSQEFRYHTEMHMIQDLLWGYNQGLGQYCYYLRASLGKIDFKGHSVSCSLLSDCHWPLARNISSLAHKPHKRAIYTMLACFFQSKGLREREGMRQSLLERVTILL